MKERLKNLLKSIKIYHPLQTAFRSCLSFFNLQLYRVIYAKYKGRGFTCNYCGASYEQFIPEFPSRLLRAAIYGNEVIAGYGKNVYCPNCWCRNRERLVKAVLQRETGIPGKRILHFSPEKRLLQFLKTSAQVTAVDLQPEFYLSIDPSIHFADATALTFPDESFDILIANHILEHIPDDRKAMSELHRVLKGNGLAILQVPYSEKIALTMEEPMINNPIRQMALFGQKDHVRIYAKTDYVARLEAAGFKVKILSPGELLNFRIYAIQENESVFICTK